jgi:peroxiredoxin Q/BCP
MSDSDWIEPGQAAPAFTLTADDGSKVRLADLKGSPVVLYFYPKDDTPGCTKEACAFRDQQRNSKNLVQRYSASAPIRWRVMSSFATNSR